jgi:hypothetical protein
MEFVEAGVFAISGLEAALLLVAATLLFFWAARGKR